MQQLSVREGFHLFSSSPSKFERECFTSTVAINQFLLFQFFLLTDWFQEFWGQEFYFQLYGTKNLTSKAIQLCTSFFWKMQYKKTRIVTGFFLCFQSVRLMVVMELHRRAIESFESSLRRVLADSRCKIDSNNAKKISNYIDACISSSNLLNIEKRIKVFAILYKSSHRLSFSVFGTWPGL